MDFKEVATRSLPQAMNLLTSWLPGGKLIGSEFTCGSLQGESGKSLKVNVKSGRWSDFASGDKGGDLVSLYAAIRGISQQEAMYAVASEIGYTNGQDKNPPAPPPAPPPQPAPQPSPLPDKRPSIKGSPSEVYEYRDEQGRGLFLIARFDTEDGKTFTPLTYVDGKWQRKAYPAPRPLFGLESLGPNILIVEGERAALAAREFASPKYSVVTWSGGAQAVGKSDWSPLYGRKILIWPDHDEPGRKASARIASLLLTHCDDVKIINTQDDDLADSWDAADSGFTWDTFLAWAKPRAVAVKPPSQPSAPLPDAPMSTTNILVAGDEAIAELTSPISSNETKNIKRCGLQTSARGLPTENLLNVSKILATDFSGKFWFDEFYRSFYTNINGTPEPLNDKHILDAQAMIQALYGLRKVSKSMVTDALTSVSYSDTRNAAKDYFGSLKWDGAPRMADFFGNACGAEDSLVNQAISRYFFVSMIARILGPDLDPIYGNKVDSMLVLEGDQGLAKGMLLKLLVGKAWHFEVSKGSKSKDFFQDMRGKLLGEVAELASFDGENLDVIKRMITCQTDRLRISYGKESQDFDRTCILVGTTNKDEYLTDDTGNRRFLPMRVNKVDLDYVIANRDQLFAEAVRYYKENVKTWWAMPKDDLDVERSSRMVTDEWRKPIEQYLFGLSQVEIYDVWTSGLRQDIGKLDRRYRNQIASVLKSLGWVSRVTWNKDKSKSEKRWVKPDRVVIPPTRHVINHANFL